LLIECVINNQQSRINSLMNPSADFSLAGLYAAIDAQRQARGLTWQQAVLEINWCSGASRVVQSADQPSRVSGRKPSLKATRPRNARSG
jgi:hypothetical protein